MDNLLYAFGSTTIAALLLALMMLAIEAGYRGGRRRRASADDSLRDQTKVIEASILGLLSLLLGFTFTMALQHYDARHHAMVSEANAIGTAWFRAGLLPDPHGARAAQRLRDYLDLRLQAGEANLTHSHPFAALAEKTAGLQHQLWAEATAAARKDPGPVTTGLFAQAVNDLMDAQVERNAALERHVPASAIALLIAVAVAGAFVAGYAAGLGGQRPALGTAALSVIIVLVVFMIADLDRPRRGLVQVGQQDLLDLRSALHAEPAR
ncbi:MAG: hypothetical protein AABY95_00125 [Pseudomonadota bacterium]